MCKFRNVRDITKQYLEAEGYDGLFRKHLYCACTTDDLMPISECTGDCEAGYLHGYVRDGDPILKAEPKDEGERCTEWTL